MDNNNFCTFASHFSQTNTTNMQKDFEQHIKRTTIVYDRNDNMIECINGAKQINPKDYENYLPIRYEIVETTTQILQSVSISKS